MSAAGGGSQQSGSSSFLYMLAQADLSLTIVPIATRT